VSSEALANAVRSRFAAQVETPQGLWVIYDNQDRSPPSDERLWCRFTVLDGDTERVTIGVRQYRTVGLGLAQLFVPMGTGTKAIRVMADAIRAAFQDVSTGGVRYGVPRVENIGDDGKGKYQVNVTCPWQVDETET
jgi:hypothetical protein